MQENRSFDLTSAPCRRARLPGSARRAAVRNRNSVFGAQPEFGGERESRHDLAVPSRCQRPRLAFLADCPMVARRAPNAGTTAYDLWRARRAPQHDGVQTQRLPYYYARADASLFATTVFHVGHAVDGPKSVLPLARLVGQNGNTIRTVPPPKHPGTSRWSQHRQRRAAARSGRDQRGSGIQLDDVPSGCSKRVSPGRSTRHRHGPRRCRAWGWTDARPYSGNYGCNSLLYFNQLPASLPGSPLYEASRRGTDLQRQHVQQRHAVRSSAR